MKCQCDPLENNVLPSSFSDDFIKIKSHNRMSGLACLCLDDIFTKHSDTVSGSCSA